MKAILEFDLPDEASEHNCAVNAVKMHSIIIGLQENLRSYRKYGHNFDCADDAIDSISNYINEEMIWGIE